MADKPKKPDNPVKRLRDELEAEPPPRPEPVKGNRTLYLNKDQFMTFKRYCDAKDLRPSEVIDRLIGMFLEDVKDDVCSD